jgi:hypothetical protein
MTKTVGEDKASRREVRQVEARRRPEPNITSELSLRKRNAYVCVNVSRGSRVKSVNL